MKSLSETESPKLGLEVVSAIGTPGRVVEIHHLSKADVEHWRDTEIGELLITIKWEHDGHSTFPQSQLNSVHVKDIAASPIP